MKTLAWATLNLLQWLFVAAWSVLWISLALLATLLTFSRDVALVMARRFYAPALVRGTGARFEVDPLPDIDWSRPHIYAMNHQSTLDIVCAFEALPANLRFVAKHSLKYVPFLGWYMWATKMVFMNRAKGREAYRSLQEAGQRIREGASIIAFPEGTRSPDGRLLPFKKGVFQLATEAGVPIVPVAIEGSHRVLPGNSWSIRPGLVRLRVGQPIPTAGRNAAQRAALMLEVREAIAALQRELGGPPPHPQQPAAAEGEAPAARPAPALTRGARGTDAA
jgi:1-acyl-sn-glycerol-3-phosphate acyltransferase